MVTMVATTDGLGQVDGAGAAGAGFIEGTVEDSEAVSVFVEA